MTTAAVRASKRIHKITIRRMVDESPDTSWLGEYANSPTSDYSIDRAHDDDCPQFWAECEPSDDNECNCVQHGRWSAREYRYFNPSFNYVDKQGHALPENTPDEVRKYVRQDYERMESLNRGDWCFVGIRAEAEYIVGGTSETGHRYHGTIQRITSGGLWGIESDSDASHFAEVEAEQLTELREQLTAIGFSKRAIAAAFRDVEHAD